MRKELEEHEVFKQIEEPEVSRNTGSLKAAIKAVYEEYGSDLPRFFRDAYKEAERRRKESNGEEAVML